MKKRILLIAGTRPNFIKLAPLYHRLKSRSHFESFICHTGQHFDFNMSDIFWQNLELPQPDFQLNIKGNGVVDIIGKTLLGINEILIHNHFDLVIVFGDVNATVAGAIAAAQSRLKIMHVEAGLRSFDRDMPEEINRVITDHVADYLMISEPQGMKNLEKEGFDKSKYQMMGNIMIEALIYTRPKWEKIIFPQDWNGIENERPVVMTFHRPENVDQEKSLTRVVHIINSLVKENKLVFPVHPRTKAKLGQFNLLKQLEENSQIKLTEPLSYFHFLKIVSKAGMVITDSGGVQEETTFLNIPCVTFRRNTERPVTVEMGTNILMDIWDDGFMSKLKNHKEAIEKTVREPVPYWDENVSERITSFIEAHIGIS